MEAGRQRYRSVYVLVKRVQDVVFLTDKKMTQGRHVVLLF